jgi:hypothetical protein
MIQEKLDRQAGELTRIARRLDATTEPNGRAELQVGRLLQTNMERLYAEWPKEVPPGWPDERAKMLARVGAQRQVLLHLAGALDLILGGDVRGQAEQRLSSAHDARPISLAAKFHEAPIVYTPDALEKDFAELVFEAHEDILQLLQDALEEAEAAETG